MQQHATAQQHGVLVMRGEDRRGALAFALRFLCEGTVIRDVSNFKPANITMAWVRGVGAFGGVMLRFVTDEASMRVFEDPENWEHVKARIAQVNGDEHAKMDMVVRRAEEPVDRDPSLTQQLFYFDTIEDLGLPANHSLSHFAAILAADGKIDICQHDRVLFGQVGTRYRFRNAFRLYDHGRRGGRWLKGKVRSAASDAFEEAPAVEFGGPDVLEYTKATLQLEAALASSQQGYAYLYVHCEDRPGLFARLASFLQTTPGVNGKPANRAVLRSCCRGLGSEALLLLAASADESDAAELDRRLAQFLKAEGILTTSKSCMAVVRHSILVPTVVNHLKHDEIQTGGFTLRDNKPGALYEICKAIPAKQHASVYYLDGRERMDNCEADAPNGRFGCSFGLVVPNDSTQDLRAQIRQSLEGNLRPRGAEGIWFKPSN